MGLVQHPVPLEYQLLALVLELQTQCLVALGQVTRHGLGARDDVGGLGLGALAALHDLVLSEAQHGLQTLAHALDAFRRSGQPAQLALESVRFRPCDVDLASQLTVLLDRGVPVRGQHAELSIQVSQIVIDLRWVITPPGDSES